MHEHLGVESITLLAVYVAAMALVQPQAARADEPEHYVSASAVPTSAGAPKMPNPLNLAKFELRTFCTQDDKNEDIITAGYVKDSADAFANRARDYLSRMRIYIETERRVGKKSDIALDEHALDIFERNYLRRLTIIDPQTAEENIATAEQSRVVDCSRHASTGYRDRRKGAAPQESHYAGVPEVTGDLQPAGAATTPNRTPTLSGLHRAPPATVKKRAPSNAGVHAPLIPPPTHGAIPTPPAAKTPDIRDIKVP